MHKPFVCTNHLKSAKTDFLPRSRAAVFRLFDKEPKCTNDPTMRYDERLPKTRSTVAAREDGTPAAVVVKNFETKGAKVAFWFKRGLKL